MQNYLICWADKTGEKHWDMIKETDHQTFLMNLIYDSSVDKPTIFIMPTVGMMASAIWLLEKYHKSSRVDFSKFYEDFGSDYKKPAAANPDIERTAEELNERTSDNTKYGWLSPDGRYFHCGYQGHNALAARITFGMADTDNSERYLETNGWIKIYKPWSNRKYCIYIEKGHKVTNRQMQTLIDMELDTAEGLSEALLNE